MPQQARFFPLAFVPERNADGYYTAFFICTHDLIENDAPVAREITNLRVLISSFSGYLTYPGDDDDNHIPYAPGTWGMTCHVYTVSYLAKTVDDITTHIPIPHEDFGTFYVDNNVSGFKIGYVRMNPGDILWMECRLALPTARTIFPVPVDPDDEDSDYYYVEGAFPVVPDEDPDENWNVINFRCGFHFTVNFF